MLARSPPRAQRARSRRGREQQRRRGSQRARRVPLAEPGDAGELLDARAEEAYRRRLREIDEDIEEARANGDGERAAQADAERDFILREFGRAVGLGGRDRRAAGLGARPVRCDPAPSGRPSPGSPSTMSRSESTLTTPCAPGPTARTRPTPAATTRCSSDSLATASFSSPAVVWRRAVLLRQLARAATSRRCGDCRPRCLRDG